MSSNLDDWWNWRNRKDARDQAMDSTLAQHTTEIEVLKVRQRISDDNNAARHSKTPQVIFWIISGGISLVALLLQLWALGGGVKP